MIDAETVLGINLLKTMGYEEISQILLKRTIRDVAPMGTPCWAGKNKGSYLGILFPFPSNYNLHARTNYSSAIARSDTIHREGIDLTKVMIETVINFNRNSIDRLIEKAKEEGVAIVSIGNRRKMGFINNIWEVIDRFKYSCVLEQHTSSIPNSVIKPDYIIPIVTFFDMSQCIPIFNKKKADGICFNYETVIANLSRRKGRIIATSRISMILSQYKENLFYVDGVEVIKPQTLSQDTVDAVKAKTEQKIVFKNRRKVENKKKRKVARSVEEVMDSFNTSKYKKTTVNIGTEYICINTSSSS